MRVVSGLQTEMKKMNDCHEDTVHQDATRICLARHEISPTTMIRNTFSVRLRMITRVVVLETIALLQPALMIHISITIE